MGSINSRKKGTAFECKIAQDFREIGFANARTARQVSRIADDCKIDIVNCGGYAPQCKALSRYASINEVLNIEWEKYNTIIGAVEPLVPILITKGDRLPTMVAMPFEHFKYLLTQLHAIRN